METLNRSGNSLNARWDRLLFDKPMWVPTLVYTAFTGIFFGLVYLLIYLLVSQRWVAATIVVAIGITWGAVTHRARSNDNSDE